MIELEAEINKPEADEMNRLLLKLQDRKSLIAIHESLGEEMINIIRERFDKSVDSYGNQFRPIKDYIYRSAAGQEGMKRTSANAPLKVLHLFRSFNYVAGRDKVEIGTPIDYAKYHTDFPSNNGAARRYVPRREFLGVFTPKDVGRLREVVTDSLKASLGGV